MKLKATHRIMLVLPLIIVPITLASFPLVSADIARDYHRTVYTRFGIAMYSFELNLAIETEEDGTWIVGEYYQINFRVTLDDYNRDMFENEQITIMAHDPRIVGIESQDHEVMSNETGWLSVGQPSFIYVRCHIAQEEKYSILPEVHISVWRDNEYSNHLIWDSDEYILIEAKSDELISQIPNQSLTYLFIFTTIVFIGTTIYFARRKT